MTGSTFASPLVDADVRKPGTRQDERRMRFGTASRNFLPTGARNVPRRVPAGPNSLFAEKISHHRSVFGSSFVLRVVTGARAATASAARTNGAKPCRPQ